MALERKVYGGILLVAGTAIGAGMLSLPLRLGVGGLSGSTLMMLFGFLYMLSTLFLLLEVLFYQKESLTLIGLSRKYLGSIGASTAWICFLSLLYIASAAYIIGATDLISSFTQHYIALSSNMISIIFSCMIGLVTFYGVRWIDVLNRPLMIGLVFCFFALLFLIAPNMQLHNNFFGKPEFLIASTPLVILAFTSHIVLPSLKPYLEDHIPSMKRVMVIGSVVPLIIYLVWIYLILLLLPFDGPGSIMEIAANRHGELSHLSDILSNNFSVPGLSGFYITFSFLAILTSFLGVVLSLSDFLKDGLGLDKRAYSGLINVVLTLAPPLLIVIFNPSGFSAVLNYGGVIIAILFSIIPVCIAWKARYVLNIQSEYQLPGGKPILLLIGLIGLIVILTQILTVQQMLPTP